MRSKRTAIVVLAPALLLAVAIGLAPGVPAQTTSTCTVTTSDQAVDAEEQALLGLVNQYRTANGRPPLAFHSGVTKAAAWFSRDMATKNYFPADHVDSNGRAPNARLSWCGVSYGNWAENIYAGTPDAQSTFDAWRNSSIHNANMLRPGVTSAGIARAYQAGSTYGWYWTLDVTDSATAPATTTSTTRLPSPTTTTRPAVTTTAPPTTTPTSVPPTTPTTIPWWCAYTTSC